MDSDKLRDLLDAVAAGRVPAEQAFERLRRLPYDDLGFAKVDLHRALRAGGAEAVFCPGKTPEQVREQAHRTATETKRGSLTAPESEGPWRAGSR